MPVFTNNSQLIHVVSELVAFVTMMFYFNQKNKQLQNHIQELVHRLEEQDDIIQKHEEMLKLLVDNVAILKNGISNSNSSHVKLKQDKMASNSSVKPTNNLRFAPKTVPKTTTRSINIQELSDHASGDNSPVNSEISETKTGDLSPINLDDELAEELAELGLKKRLTMQ